MAKIPLKRVKWVKWVKGAERIDRSRVWKPRFGTRAAATLSIRVGISPHSQEKITELNRRPITCLDSLAHDINVLTSVHVFEQLKV